ncbi:MAG: hypothetical protein JO170_07485 [Verrucomicrobia bacterium]|nr:hypothetical protein [Verrucomicrobiota bacterium]
MNTPIRQAPGELQKSHISFRLFVFGALLLVAVTIVRSAITTQLDGFTIDEAYHIAAGVCYVRQADFRVNPEQPPLVKVWVGNLISATGFHQSSIRTFADKADERDFTEQDVYLNNDFNSVQRRARIAMWTLNGLLLLFLGLAVHRTFGAGIALGTLLFLAIDPTVAAHLPVVMMDLPVSLLSATAVTFGIRAFQEWNWKDLLSCSLALGLALATKHSAPIFLVFLASAGAGLALFSPVLRSEDSRFARLAKLSTVLAGALIVLWAFYLFRFTESNSEQEVFNRTLANKIADLNSVFYRSVLTGLEWTHIVPRAYIWGFADTVRAGLQGRVDPITAFGRAYLGTGPRYFFPAMIALKLPIGLTVLVLIGLFASLTRRTHRESRLRLAMLLGAALAFLLVLTLGSTYGGIRHALPVVVLLAVFGGCAIQAAFTSRSRFLKAVVGAALVTAMASALPVMRPWGYFNEIIGGANDAFLYFSDEGVDLGQRATELAQYYHRILEPAGEVPIIEYGPIGQAEKTARHLDWVGRDPNRDESRFSSPIFSGTVVIDAKFLGKKPFWDNPSLRDSAPAVRFGNLLIFTGTFSCSALLAQGRYVKALSKIYAEEPDWEAAERLLRQSVNLDPSAFFAFIELGNVCVKRGAREDALQAYSDALKHTPKDCGLRPSIEDQIRKTSSLPLTQVPELRDPFLE